MKSNKDYVRALIWAALGFGFALGFWFGRRAPDASMIEFAGLWIAFIVASVAVYSWIDRRYRPENFE